MRGQGYLKNKNSSKSTGRNSPTSAQRTGSEKIASGQMTDYKGRECEQKEPGFLHGWINGRDT